MSYSATPLLKYSMRTNAVTSLVTGLLCLITNGFLSDLMGLTNSLYLYGVGAGLILFSAGVYATSVQNPVKPLYVKIIIAADTLWVIDSVLLTTFMPDFLTTTGNILVQVIALGVLGFVIMQTIGLKQTTQESAMMA